MKKKFATIGVLTLKYRAFFFWLSFMTALFPTLGLADPEINSDTFQEISRYSQQLGRDYKIDAPWRVESADTTIPFEFAIKDVYINDIDENAPGAVNGNWEWNVKIFNNCTDNGLDGFQITPMNLGFNSGDIIYFRAEITGSDDGGPILFDKYLKVVVGAPLSKPIKDWYYGDTHYHSEYTNNPYKYDGTLHSTLNAIKAKDESNIFFEFDENGYAPINYKTLFLPEDNYYIINQDDWSLFYSNSTFPEVFAFNPSDGQIRVIDWSMKNANGSYYGDSLLEGLSSTGDIAVYLGFSGSESWSGYTVHSRHLYLYNYQTKESFFIDGVQNVGDKGFSYFYSMSADGRFITFASDMNFTEEEQEPGLYTYLADTSTKKIIKLSLSPPFAGSNREKHSIVAHDGSYAFYSDGSSYNKDPNYRYTVDLYKIDTKSFEKQLIISNQPATIGHAKTRGDKVFFSGYNLDSMLGTLYVFDGSNNEIIELGEVLNKNLDGTYTGPYDISESGRFVTFYSNLSISQEDNDGAVDVYVADLLTGDSSLIKTGIPFGTYNNKISYFRFVGDEFIYYFSNEQPEYLRGSFVATLNPLYVDPPSPGFSCTCNTLGLPLDSTSCFSTSKHDSGGIWEKVILKKGVKVFAQASLAGNEGGFCVQNLLWETPDGTPITDWSGLYGGLESVDVEFVAERSDGTEVDLGSRKVKQSQFNVEVSADESFPMSGPQAAATFTASPSGGTAPYTYKWTTVMDYVLDGYGHNSWSTTNTAYIELPAYGEKYPAYPDRWGSFNSLHQINLEVTDAAGKVANVKYTAAVTSPQLTGNPSLSGSGSQLLRGVDVASGNYHLSATDISISGKGPDFVATRAYNSNINKKGTWAFNLDMRAWFGSHSMGREISIGPREDGRTQYFFSEFDGSWKTLNPGCFDQLVENADGTLTLYTQGNLFYNFADPLSDLHGCLKSISDRDGNAITFTHDANNRIIGAKDAAGRSYTITRSNEGQIIKIADFSGRNVQYTWNKDNMITEFRNPRGNSTTFSYSSDKLTSIIDPLKKTQVTIAYNGTGKNSGRASSVTDGEGNAWVYSYTTVVDANDLQGTGIARPATNGINNNILFVIDKARTKVLERVDSVDVGEFRTTQRFRSTESRSRIAEMGLVELNQQPSGTGTEISYTDDGNGNPSKITNGVRANAGANDPKLTTEATFDKVTGQTNLTPLKTITRPGVPTPTKYETFTPSGKAQIITDPLGYTTKRTYQTNGLLTQSTDAKTQTSNYTYNADGTLKKVTDPLGKATNYTYDSLGRMETTTNPKGQQTVYTYDANNNVTKTEVTANGVTLSTTSIYDNSDNLLSVTDPRGNSVNYKYDILNRKIEEGYKVAGVDRVRRFEYDAMGRLSRVINEKDNASETRFDARGKVLQEINPLSKSITYTYDENGNVLTVTDAENRSMSYQYDILDRKINVTDALGNVEEYRYNGQGLLDKKLDSRRFWTAYGYDDLGRMTMVHKMAGEDGEEGEQDIVTQADYDKNGNMISVTDPNGKITTYEYDALNRMISLKDPENRLWKFSYDTSGNMLTRITPDNKTTTYVYDGFDRLEEMRYPDGPTITFTYDENGNRLTMTDSNGITRYSYDEQNRLTSVTDTFGNLVGYDYDPAGMIEALIYPGNHKVEYEHDAAGRLATLKDWLGNTTRYTRDDSGIIKTVNYGNGTIVKKDYDDAGRMVELFNLKKNQDVISSHTLTLDAGGNPISANLDLPLMPVNFGKAAEMIYDAGNRLTKVGDSTITHDTDGRLLTDQSGTDPIQYAFNAQDLITSVTKSGVLTDSYAYDGDGRRISRTTSGQTTRYVNDPTGGDMYRLLAETNASNAVQRYYIYGEGLVSQISGSTHSYYHFDQSGNTLALTNDAGAVTDTYAYEPFGNTTTQGSTPNPFKFVGEYGVMDDGNGLHQMRARYYRSDLRRFISLDSLYGEITDPMALNRYQYVSGNPMVGVDPSGMECKNTTDKYTVQQGGGNYVSSKECEKSFYGINYKAGYDQVIDGSNKSKYAEGNMYFSVMPDKNHSSYFTPGVKVEVKNELGYGNIKEQGKFGVQAGAGFMCISENVLVEIEAAGIKLQGKAGLAQGACIGGKGYFYYDGRFIGVAAEGIVALFITGADIDVNIGLDTTIVLPYVEKYGEFVLNKYYRLKTSILR